MPTAAQILALSVGGVLGVHARYWLGLALAHWLGTRFPWATFLVNLTGSFAIGLLATVIAGRYPDPIVRLGVVTGFLGGYTTFSSYVLESFALWERGERTLALANTLGSVGLGLMAVVLGVVAGQTILGPPTPREGDRVVLEQRIEAIAEAEAGEADPRGLEG